MRKLRLDPTRVPSSLLFEFRVNVTEDEEVETGPYVNSELLFDLSFEFT